MLNLFISIAKGSRQPEKCGEWDRKEASVRLIYIQDHTDVDAAPQAKLRLKRDPPKKPNQEAWQSRERRSPLVLADMGHRLRTNTPPA